MIRFEKKRAKDLEPEDNPPAPNRSAASLKTVFAGGKKTTVAKGKKRRKAKAR
jgi:hypothetical protein